MGRRRRRRRSRSRGEERNACIDLFTCEVKNSAEGITASLCGF